MLHGPQQGVVDLRFETPAQCATLLKTGEVDIGLVPVIELERQPLEIIPGLGIASTGAVRSILLISKVPVSEMRSLAADSSSRTSVVLARIVLAERFGVRPHVEKALPVVSAMLEHADACLVIGDPALRVDPESKDLHIYDLGFEWTQWTGLPMVYAVWAARSGFDWIDGEKVLRASWQFGRDRIDTIAARECESRQVSATSARDYLTRNIEFELSDNHLRGLARFRQLARSTGSV